MEDSKLLALHDSLSGHKGRKGLGSGKAYSWQKSTASNDSDRDDDGGDGLPKNRLYSNFLREGNYNPDDATKNYGDGRTIKKDFSEYYNQSDSDSDSEGAKKRKKQERSTLHGAEHLYRAHV